MREIQDWLRRDWKDCPSSCSWTQECSWSCDPNHRGFLEPPCNFTFKSIHHDHVHQKPNIHPLSSIYSIPVKVSFVPRALSSAAFVGLRSVHDIASSVVGSTHGPCMIATQYLSALGDLAQAGWVWNNWNCEPLLQ